MVLVEGQCQDTTNGGWLSEVGFYLIKVGVAIA